MKILKSNTHNFFTELGQFLSKRNENTNIKIEDSVKSIIAEVKKYGDEALLKYTKEFDNQNLKINEILLNSSVRNSYKEKINNNIFDSFKKTIKNVRKFHDLQLPKDYEIKNKGAILKSRWKPIDSVGLYVPGGRTIYPSSLIMNAVPAKIAGVKRIVCVTPPTKYFNPYILGLFDELGIEEVYQIGGAQAIAALAFGTQSINSVNKIFGPGNAYVSSAKKQVYGKVGIDLIAGPSEIIVVADNNNNPQWVATDLMAQAEHDVNAQSILITESKQFADKVKSQIAILVQELSKKNIIEKSLSLNGLIILIDDILDSSEIINFIAPEHLHLQIDKKEELVDKIFNAGLIFLGEYTTEAFGDYILGTNHILPTYGSSKFSSGLSVLDFMKRNSIVEIDKDGYEMYKDDVQQMADIENFDAHKLSVKIRQS